MRKNLQSVFDYFSYFSYAPTFKDILTFFPRKITKKNLQLLLIRELKLKKLIRIPNRIGFGLFPCSTNHYSLTTNHSLYTLPQYSITTSPRLRGASQIISKRAFGTIQTYFSFLKLLPLVRFVGMTGKSAMEGIRENDDIDLFIVSKEGWIWTTRFICVILAKMLGIYHQTGVCLNLFFDENDLSIPSKKQNSYIAHEILQMKPVFDKDAIYSIFIQANVWIYEYFPNARKLKAQSLKLKATNYPLSPNPYSLDMLFKHLQLPIINKNKTSLFITDTQLWLFRKDFEKKLKRNGLGR